MRTVIGTIASVIVGGIVATATIFGVVSSQTSPSDQSPANVNAPVVDYGTK